MPDVSSSQTAKVELYAEGLVLLRGEHYNPSVVNGYRFEVHPVGDDVAPLLQRAREYAEPRDGFVVPDVFPANVFSVTLGADGNGAPTSQFVRHAAELFVALSAVR